MKKHLTLLAGGLMLIGLAAVAAPAPQRGDQGQQDNQDWHDHHDKHDDQGDHGHDRGRDDHRGYDDRRGYYVSHDRGRHEGWYKRGGYVPVEYRDRRYVVDDWRVYHLRQPPYGYHYVRGDDGQFLLVAVATGVIADILLSH
ncbi:hypothetical protein B0E46_05860 [Rhodanobacter sp. B04]|uniref:RcnB family protein n=1 Tax=Rhodanobacter sp. B04 TaxID=1945860 RepID=UPI000984562A|nr:RcnB family protein [Rhodanobacter sp. B04]OOG64915.1 hypothetical protein B0E46_05860 [Rhodanobacter sp. B04]